MCSESKNQTKRARALKICSPIDFFLIPRHQIYLVEQIETVISNAPDHKAVKLKFNCPNSKRRSGLWKFNNALLEDEGYVNLIRENYAYISEKYSGQEDKRFKWEFPKLELRGLIISFAKNKVKNLRQIEMDLQKRRGDLHLAVLTVLR